MNKSFILWPWPHFDSNLPRDSDLVELNDQGIKIKAIAKRYGLATGTVGRRLSQARQRLAQGLDGQAD